MSQPTSGIRHRVEMADVSSLRPHPRNPRTITDERLEHLKMVLEADPEMLDARPLVALPDGTVVAGNQRLRAVTELGWEQVQCVTVDLDEDRAVEWAIRDNEGFGETDRDVTAELLRELEERGRDLALTGMTQEALDEILAVRVGSGIDPDVVPGVPDEVFSELGGVYGLGQHVLFCGDALNALDVLYEGIDVGCVLTDPPYGINLNTDYSTMPTGNQKALLRGTRGRTYAKVVGDDSPFDPSSFVGAFEKVKEQFWFGGDYYRRLLSPDDRDGSWLVWDKRNEASDGGLGSGFELIWSKARHKRDLLRFYFFGAFGSEGANRLHPTQKPTKLLAEILERWAPPGCVVADPFSGSGSVLIACEMTGRVSYSVEIDPGYCDVIRRRYALFVGDQQYDPGYGQTDD